MAGLVYGVVTLPVSSIAVRPRLDLLFGLKAASAKEGLPLSAAPRNPSLASPAGEMGLCGLVLMFKPTSPEGC